MRALWAVLAVAAVSSAAAVTAVVSTVSSGSIKLSTTSLLAGSPFTVDQSDVSNAGYPFWLNLEGASPGWSASYTCPTGACDASTYTALRTHSASTGKFVVSYQSSPFQSKSVPYGPAGGAASGSLAFSLSTQPSYWVYGVSVGILVFTVAVNVYAIGLV